MDTQHTHANKCGKITLYCDYHMIIYFFFQKVTTIQLVSDYIIQEIQIIFQ